MAQFRTGDMWSSYDEADLFLITTNATITIRGTLVMGRGIARQAKERFPGLDVALGRQIQALCGNQGIYGLLISPRWPAAKLGAFQVKRHYSQPASLELIRHSAAALYAWCAEHPDAQVVLNFPGIGNGRLRRADVLPIVTQLPEQVTIWEYPPLARRTSDDQPRLESTSKNRPRPQRYRRPPPRYRDCPAIAGDRPLARPSEHAHCHP